MLQPAEKDAFKQGSQEAAGEQPKERIAGIGQSKSVDPHLVILKQGSILELPLKSGRPKNGTFT